MRHTVVKRVVDVAGAISAGILLSPLLLSISVVLLATQGRPLFFRHVRVGYRERSFTLVKFRTMRAPKQGEVWYLTDADRMTRVGRLLRSTSLDELPELWNVLRGEMSLVGPRPLLVEYLPHYTDEQRRRHHVRPGITGWAAVNGRHAIKFQERLALDVWYVDHRSLSLDFRIMGRTFVQLLRREHVAASENLVEVGFPHVTGSDSETRDSTGTSDR